MTTTTTTTTVLDPTVLFDPHPLSGAFRYVNLYTDKACPQVLVVALARPRKRNALNARLWKEIGLVFDAIGNNNNKDSLSAIRSVLLIGEGKGFCGGIDVTDISFFPHTSAVRALRGKQGDNDDKDNNDDVALVGLKFLPLLRQMQASFTALETCPVPVVAAIHGSCIGAGVDLVTAADVRLTTANATFSVREVALGLAADVGTLQRLPKICGNQAWVRSVCLTGRDFDGTTACRQGLAAGDPHADCAAVWDAGLQLCRTMAQHSPVAVRGTKQSLLYARDHNVTDSLEQVAAYSMLALQSPQFMHGMQTRLMGQQPVYQDMPPSSRL